MAGGNVVVVEADATLRKALEAALSSKGYGVFAAVDPAQAVAAARQALACLVLCEVELPGSDGYLVMKALKAHPATAHCPVILISGSTRFSERARAFRAGAADFLTKPLSFEILLRKVELLTAGTPAEAAEAAEAPSGHTRLDALMESKVAPQAPAFDASGLPDPYFLPKLLRNVLVVDDDPNFRRLLAHFLRSQTFTVYEAADGEQGLAVALERRPWLILADLEMPGVDGLELCRRIRQHTLLRHTPFIFLSGWDDYRERQQGLGAGADDFLSKQAPLREVLLRIYLILRRFADVGGRSRTGAAMEGRLDLVGAAALLQICHAGLMSGILAVHSGRKPLEVWFREGDVVNAHSEDRDGFEAVVELLGWERGYYEFLPGGPFEGPPLAKSFEGLLLEGCRVMDERRRSETS